VTKREHIKYWVETATLDLTASNNLFKSKDYLHSLFFAHLHLEKLCKALWIKKNKGDTPPKIHNLVKLLNESSISYSESQLDFMLVMNNFQLEGRYPDYKQKLYRNYKRENTLIILKQ
jgi:HEPN domain-containing protein